MSDRLYGLQCRMRYMWKHSSKVSYSLTGIGHPPHTRGCVTSLFCALHSRSSLGIFFVWCCLLFRWISVASDSANDGYVTALLYMSWSSSSRLFSMLHMVVPSGLCKVACVCFVGYYVSLYGRVGV